MLSLSQAVHDTCLFPVRHSSLSLSFPSPLLSSTDTEQLRNLVNDQPATLAAERCVSDGSVRPPGRYFDPSLLLSSFSSPPPGVADCRPQGVVCPPDNSLVRPPFTTCFSVTSPTFVALGPHP